MFFSIGKEILILGGGDGGLLHELLKENPKFVTMVDIDKYVMKYCQLYLKGACGNSLDSYIGSNYRVMIGDCVEYMKMCIEQNISFDYVFNDLTDIPISDENNKNTYNKDESKMWPFVKLIIELSLKLLRPNTGKYLNHVSGSKIKIKIYKIFLLIFFNLSGKWNQCSKITSSI